CTTAPVSERVKVFGPVKVMVTGAAAPGGFDSALRLTICSVPALVGPMATLTGLAAARSLGEYCRDSIKAAAPTRGFSRNLSLAAAPPKGPAGGALPSLMDSPSAARMFCRSAMLANTNTLLSEWRVTEPAVAP